MSTPNTHLGAERIREIMHASRGKTVFFLGAGGIMMSSLALLTARAGFCVKGSDRSRSALTEKLERENITMFYSHAEENLGEDTGAVVYTVAVSPDNPEYVRAQREQIPCISRADYLGYIMTEYKNRVGVAGMHGKSSCTSMCAQIFLDAARMGESSDPTIVSGATYAPMGGAYYLGQRDHFIFEACEYMDSFLDFNPTVAILLNAEMEHVDYFKSIEQIRDSFTRYASIVGDSGTVVYNVDDENTVISADRVTANKISFGLSEVADFRAVNIDLNAFPITFDVLYKGAHFVHVSLPAFGQHSVYNALAATAASFTCGISADVIAQGLADFKGAGRRMEYKGELFGAAVYDDYGHHPTEVKATLAGAKKACRGRLICVFQPHTFSRTAALAEQFADAFADADQVVLADIYAAREENIYGISSEKLAATVGEKAVYGGDLDSIATIIKKTAQKDDMIIVMGAGDIFKVFAKLDL
ncbi:MAG: UDP-N-acetylmuramate--L-alanine ligase [Clostridia bacterium]|nr:UDP-N-acetylmuramate--L-alanine ligase [Clostridia bacterium]